MRLLPANLYRIVPRISTALALVLLVCANTAAQQSGTASGGADPAAHEGDVAKVMARLTWASLEHPRFHLHYPVGTPVGAHVPRLGRDAEAALRRNLEILGLSTSPIQGPIELFFLNSTDEMKQLIGREWGGMAMVDDRAIILVVDTLGVPLQHELMHLLTHELWGKPSTPWQWINEGVATSAVGGCGAYGAHPLAAELLSRDRLPTLANLANRFLEYDSLHRYLAAASLVQYVRDRWGLDAVRALWQQGLDAGTKSFGSSPSDLGRDWWAHLAGSTPAPASAWDEIMAKGCDNAGK